MPGNQQIYRDGCPQVYCADCLHYGNANTFPGDDEMDIVQCPDCGGERVFALTQAKKDEIDDTSGFLDDWSPLEELEQLNDHFEN
ncbi:MAG: hypothetical protein HYT20_00925 [Candidatus Nealsonbacteria bacterium]|nr:hypothetical protein [Candidatus Nealsonbacteria bacterium]